MTYCLQLVEFSIIFPVLYLKIYLKKITAENVLSKTKVLPAFSINKDFLSLRLGSIKFTNVPIWFSYSMLLLISINVSVQHAVFASDVGGSRQLY